MHASAPTTIDFALPLQVYIIETIERDTHTRRLRQVGMIAALVVGMFVSQWPVAFSTANAVPSLPISAKDAGARITSPVALERLAFAPGLIR
jgi:hypothetical protein